jgi:synaptobrevin family protein YKT6
MHAYPHSNGICGIVATDEDYPQRVAQTLLNQVCNEFVSRYPRSTYADLKPPPPPSNWTIVMAKTTVDPLPYPELKEWIQKYQDPEQADILLKVQTELDQTVVFLQKTMASVLDRGEKIDDLVAKSAYLNSSSKMFYTKVGCSQNIATYAEDDTDQLHNRRSSRTHAVMLCDVNNLSGAVDTL